jgi:hypothetical protein
MFPNGNHESEIVSRVSMLVAAFEQRFGHWPTSLKVARHQRWELRHAVGPRVYDRLLDRLETLPDDDVPSSHPICVHDSRGVSLDYADVKPDVDTERARLWLGIDFDTTHGAPQGVPEKARFEWEALTAAAPYSPDARTARELLANSARDGDWDRVLGVLKDRPDWVNAARLGGSSGYTALHQAAYHGASVAVVESLLAMRGWRLLRTSRGELPCEIASRRGHSRLSELLTPRIVAPVHSDALRAMQVYFHAAINARVADLVQKHQLRLPLIEPLQEYPMHGVWMPVPELAGGFLYWLVRGAPDPLLRTTSESSVVGNSGQQHEITAHGVRLIAQELA